MDENKAVKEIFKLKEKRPLTATHYFFCPLEIGLPYFFIILSFFLTIKFTLLFLADFS